MPSDLRRIALAGAPALAFVPVLLLHAQDPVIKPRTTATTVSRLVAPSTIVARQLPDGRIEVSWTRVDGAVAYRVTRSVPNLQPEQPISPDPRDSTYVDADVKAGYNYYYIVAAVNEAGQIGLKRGSTPVNARISAGTTTTTTTPVATTPAPRPPAPVEVENYRYDARTFVVWWAEVSGAREYVVERWIFRPEAADASKADESSGRLEKAANVNVSTYNPLLGSSNPRRYVDSLGGAAEFRWVQYRVRPGAPYPATMTGSSIFKPVPPGGPITSSTPTPATGTPVPPAGTLAPTRSVGVQVGRASALGQMTGITNAQWVSADPSIASVSADGTVTGHVAGAVSVVAVVPQTDGSVRATVVRVMVTP